ncbi:Outer membrane protein beta-barrel domain-containing protein [Roseomonas rosea]|uniref:Outer membrane protein beta-barrel domain-containing protein n=1 Tax=Muricoccus roseus TaxID=198092 RepID=A0A1M6SL67_9PROT|nr:OmpA family protein [Roseomonas rosea]SHK45390.1 Outer membrane protein beta-barrel domain-containing protein [Roseomonas rosea]
MSFRKALLAATMLALPLAAQAQPVSGLYIAAGAGANWLQDARLGATGPLAEELRLRGVNPGGKVSFDVGWAAVASLGWGFGNGLRAEIEGNYRENEVDKIRGFQGVTTTRVEGTSRSYGVMGNVLYDLDLSRFGMPSYVQPYIGGGIGYIWREFDDVRFDVIGATVRSSGTDGRFAYQGIAGVGVPLTRLGVTGLTLTAEYRFLGTLEHSIDTTSSGGGFSVGRGGTRSENYNHSVMLGLRYAFNQPRPAPVAAIAPAAPAAAPAPARTYLVFFDFDRADLTDRARQIIADAAQAVTSTGTTRIEVAGHADRSGTPQYNQRLSMRRAEAVAAELSRRGIARNQMSIQAFGESRPLVATADGVREPQNRRVEIVLR